MPHRGHWNRSTGTLPVSADHADGLDSPVSTLPRISRSSLQQAFRLRQRIPAQRAPQGMNQAGSARFQVFPPTATIDHHAGAFRPGARGCGGLVWPGTRSPFLDSIKSAIMEASRTLSPCGTAQTLPLRLADSSPQASCGPSPPKTLLGTWEFTAPHVRSGSMSRFTRDQIQ